MNSALSRRSGDSRSPCAGRASAKRPVALKALGWAVLRLGVATLQRLAERIGYVQRVDVIIYKVDRLGDWMFAEPAIVRLVAATAASGGSVVVWASRESAGMRAWRPLGCRVETIVFEPKGALARARRTWSVMRLLATYRARTLYCLRHGPDPVRDFILAAVGAENLHALSWRIAPGEPDEVPHEIRRHHHILSGAGVAPEDVRALLPRLDHRCRVAGARVVVAPFTSAVIKDWPDSAWAEVVAAFASRVEEWEIWVGIEQIDRAENLVRLLTRAAGGRLQISVRSGSLGQLTDAIASARLVLTVDTMAAHLAVALDACMVGILGGGQYGDFAPWSRSWRQRWVSHRLPCFNCGWECTRPQNDCVLLITPAAVLAEMDILWTAEAASPLHAGAGDDERASRPLTKERS